MDFRKTLKPLGVAAALSLLLAGFVHLSLEHFRPNAKDRFGAILHETRTDFSHIRVRERKGVRSLHFVDEDGSEQCQSSIDLAEPGAMQLGYTRGLFASLVFCHPQDRILILGLGGGGMVRFLNGTFPTTLVEAVEIDPAVVELAAKFFGTAPGPRTRIHTVDAFHFFRPDRGLYDAIYLDAFLRAPAEAGLGEKTARLKTRHFLSVLRSHLSPGGLVAFNLIRSDPQTPEDLLAIKEVFPSMVSFAIADSGNLVVIAPLEEGVPSQEALRSRAEALDKSLGLDFSLGEIVNRRL